MSISQIIPRIGISVILLAGCIGGRVLPTRLPTPWPTYTPIPTVVEPGLAYGTPCKPPCWRGMVPGQTTRQEAARIIEQLRASGWADRVSEGPGGYSIDPLLSTPEGSILVSFEHDILIVVNGSIIFSYTVGTMVEQFGEPERLNAKLDGKLRGSCNEWVPPEAPTMSYSVLILYPEKGLAFLLLVPANGVGLICPEMRITAFCYYAPLSMLEALRDNQLASLCSLVPENLTQQDLKKWHGFGGGY